ncbi:MAG TPA: hypothetical protein VN830_10840 [Verrucomicrobiae bacterium]|nr:hypothetical protein [Verrucomicrobiae bacterium]
MNCQNAREQITDTLAAGNVELSGDLTGHVQSCAGCGTFYARQAELFLAMDSGLSAMANEPVPVSLLPRVRARMEESVSGRGWVSNRLAAAAALAVVLVAVIFFPRAEKKPLEVPVMAIPTLSKDRPEAHQHGEIAGAAAALPIGQKMIRAKASGPANTNEIAAAPEVIVLVEERQAFARFVAELPKEREVALALTRPAPAPEDVPVEIALLQIESLELNPLEATPRE